MIAANRQTGRIVLNLDADEEERLAKAALRLTLQEAENAFARAIVEDGRLDASGVDVILEESKWCKPGRYDRHSVQVWFILQVI
jgi:hypothetical protein